nr:zinc finger C2HC domain-containing protein 1A-like isoform X1 [Penaeus vannamei]XP_027219652.1 zinc finger C2HC domain-containing protein 1A-like isoform X1 [Penaeus vannamei]
MTEVIQGGVEYPATPHFQPPPELPPEFPDDGPSTLLPCTICNRTFNPQALDRHRRVCEKLSTKKRKTFDSTKQRVEGLDVSPTAAGRGKGDSKSSHPPKNKSKWREKHQEFLRAIRAARGAPNDGENGPGAPVSTIPSDYVRCPHCERHFGPKSADRHISWCREQSTRLPRSPANNEAVERLKNRTKVSDVYVRWSILGSNIKVSFVAGTGR